MSELRVTTLQHEAAAASNITLASNGNVGIGKSLPADKLHVSGESFPNIKIETNSASSGDSTLDLVGYRTTDSPVGYLKFWNNATSPTELARVTSYREGADNTGNLRFYTSSAGSLGERMRIDSAGRVTMPYQPAFKAHVSGSPSHVNATAIPFSATSLNIGSYFNTANYTFTAPVAGVYVFGGMFRVDVVATYVHLSVAINGALSKQNLELLGLSTGNGSGFTAAPFAYLRYLSAGDAVSFLGYHSVGGTQSLNEQSFLYGYLQS